ncbi:MAG: polyhydroxybutyrate depolymerase, partial [Actinobacteria bacterium]|nr:polyhydroxybutyrate depolymerase [Actinomycetota bacterium]
EETIDFDGLTRTYHLMIPTAHDAGSPLALVFDIHGFIETADQQNGRSDMRALGEAEGFIVVQPEGYRRSWNGGACCGTAASEGLDDVGLIRAIAEDVAGRACVDRARIYATGLS